MNKEEKISEIAKRIGYKVGTYCNDEEIEVFEKFLEDYKYKSNLIEKQKAEIELKQVRITNLENENNHLKLIAEEKDKIINLMASHIKHPKVIFTGGRGHQYIIEYFKNKVKESK